jgi:hypothetical protein
MVKLLWEKAKKTINEAEIEKTIGRMNKCMNHWE